MWKVRTGLGYTPLICASAFGLKEAVAALGEAGAGINVQGNRGVTPLIMASQKGHVEVVKELLRGGAAVNQAQKDDIALSTWRARRITWRW